MSALECGHRFSFRVCGMRSRHNSQTNRSEITATSAVACPTPQITRVASSAYSVIRGRSVSWWCCSLALSLACSRSLALSLSRSRSFSRSHRKTAGDCVVVVLLSLSRSLALSLSLRYEQRRCELYSCQMITGGNSLGVSGV